MPRGVKKTAEELERELARERDEKGTLKAQLAASAKKPREVLPVKFETANPDEAARYLAVGGRIVSVTKLYPKQPYKAGKRIGFAETKEQLEKMLKQAEEEGLAAANAVKTAGRSSA